MKVRILGILLFILNIGMAVAQCPMCKKSAENSAYAKSLNGGILYLLAFPFVIMIGGAIFWYFNKKRFANN